jgi:cobalamin biosynthesis protein CobT
MKKEVFETGLNSLAKIIMRTYKDCEVVFSNAVIPNCARIVSGKDVKWVITLPALEGVDVSPEDARVIHGVADHELDHKLFTDFNVGFETETLKRIANALEGARIESLGCEKYPGQSSNLAASRDFYIKTISKESMGELNEAIAALTYYGRNQWEYVKDRFALSLPYMQIVDGMIKEAVVADNTQNVHDIAVEILKKWCDAKNQQKENEEGQSEEKGKDESEEEGAGEGESGEGEQEKAEEGSKEKEDGEGDRGTGAEEGDEKENEGSAEGSTESEGEEQGVKEGGSAERGLKEIEEEAFGGVEGEGHEEGEEKALLLLIGKYKEEAKRLPYKPVRENDKVFPAERYSGRLPKVTSKYSALKVGLRRVLVTRAEEREYVGLHNGKVAYNQLYKLGAEIGTDIFKQRTKGIVIDAAVTLMVDGSGSMEPYWRRVQNLVLFLADMLKGKVDLEILIQSADWGDGPCNRTLNEVANKWDPKRNGYNRLQPIQVRVVKGFDEPHDNVKNFLSFVTTNNAIENEALRIAAKRILRRPNKRKIIFSITDGKPESFGKYESSDALQNDLEEVVKTIGKETNIELIGLGVGTTGTSLVKRYYPDYVECEDVDDLAKKGIKKLVKLLKKGITTVR